VFVFVFVVVSLGDRSDGQLPQLQRLLTSIHTTFFMKGAKAKPMFPRLGAKPSKDAQGAVLQEGQVIMMIVMIAVMIAVMIVLCVETTRYRIHGLFLKHSHLNVIYGAGRSISSTRRVL
jgi:hypothetical protein